MEMATTATGAPEQRESREQDKAGKSQIVVVDLDEPQSPVAVKRLRKGKGKLFNHVERIVKDLVDDGTVKFSFTVTRDDPSKAADCIVRTRAADGDEAGRREVLVPAGGAQRTVDTLVHTSKRAVIVEVYGCSYQVPPYLKNG